jgi:hypothetical protein
VFSPTYGKQTAMRSTDGQTAPAKLISDYIS